MPEDFVWAADESGSLGNDILFGLASLNMDAIPKLLAYNLKYAGVLIPSKDFDFDRPKYVRSLLLDPEFRFSFLLLRQKDQLGLMKETLDASTEELYKLRAKLINVFREYNEETLSSAIEYLGAFRTKRFFADAYIKSLCHQWHVEDYFQRNFLKVVYGLLKASEPANLRVWIDGGSHFSHWYGDTHRLFGRLRRKARDDLASQVEVNNVHFGCSINGVPRADETYPTVNMIGHVVDCMKEQSRILFHSTDMCSVVDGKCLDKITKRVPTQFVKFFDKLVNRYYFTKLIFYGDFLTFQDIQSTLPFILQSRSEKNEIFESYRIEKSLFDFQRDHYIKKKDKIICGRLSERESEELRDFNEKWDLETLHIWDEKYVEMFLEFTNQIKQRMNDLIIGLKDRNDVLGKIDSIEKRMSMALKKI